MCTLLEYITKINVQGGLQGLEPPTPILEGAKPLHVFRSIYSNRAVSYSNRAVIYSDKASNCILHKY